MRINTYVQRRTLPVVVVSLLAGIGPYLLPWLSGENINFFVRYAQVSYAAVNNLSYIENLFLRMQHLRILIESSGFYFYGGVHSNPLATPLFIASLVGTLSLTYISKLRGRNAFNPHLFLLAVFTFL